MIALSKRLQTVADLVIGNTLFCDVGTDHAYLPTYLLLCQKIHSAVASDIKQGPLDSAGRTAKEYGVEDRMQLILSDGLENVPDTVGEIAIAGMGGIMISDIIARASWTFDRSKHFILQPMTKIAYLRRSLYSMGFEIESETAVVDDRRPYTVMSVRYNGEKKEISDLFAYTGKLTPVGDGKEYFLLQISKLERRINGLIKADRKDEFELLKLITVKNEIEGMVKEYEDN